MSLPFHCRPIPSAPSCILTGFLTLFFGLTLAAAPLSAQAPNESQAKFGKTRGELRILSGKASVVDGRTLKVDGKTIRLKWIHSLAVYLPPTRRSAYPQKFFQTAGVSVQPAIEALKRRIGNQAVTCEVEVHKRLDLFRPRESYSGTCYLGDPTSALDLNGWLVRHGWARIDRLGSVTRYAQEETDAKAELAGAWSSVKKYGLCCSGVDSERKHDLKFPSGLD